MQRFVLALIAILALAGARPVQADAALYGFFGASTGGNFTALADGGGVDLETALKNSPVFGARLGIYSFPIGFEGSLTVSPAALEGGAFDGALQGDTNIVYTEANLLLIVLPGPVAPYVTGGVGVHYLDFQIADIVSFDQTKFGYNFGGGLRMNISALALRFDVRDHVTTFGIDDFAFGIIGGLVGIGENDTRIHNVEVSFGIGLSF